MKKGRFRTSTFRTFKIGLHVDRKVDKLKQITNR